MRAAGSGLHALVGAYVLDAVSEADRARYERHLLTCEQCRDDVRGMREASARLGAAAAVAPRPELRDSVLRAARVTRQLPPVVDGEQMQRRAWRWRRRAAASGARPWLAGLAAAVAAVLAVTALLLGLHAGAMQQRLAAQERRDSAMTAVLGAQDAVALTVAVSTGGTATVVMSHHARALVFTASGLARLPGAREYELWLAGPAGVAAAGMLPAGRHGMSGPMVVGGLAAGDRLELTVEPPGGSRQPTAAPIAAVSLGG